MLHVPTREIQGILSAEETQTELDLRGEAEAAALIGDDVQKGLVEVRRLQASAMVAYEVEHDLHEEMKEACGPSEGHEERYATWDRRPQYEAAETAADEAGHNYHYALFHMLRLPICSIADVRAKTLFALEQDYYTTDEDIAQTVLKQIAGWARAEK